MNVYKTDPYADGRSIYFNPETGYAPMSMNHRKAIEKLKQDENG